MTARMSDILRFKKSGVFCLSPRNTVAEATELILRHDIGSVVIVDAGSVQGVVTERDLLAHLATTRSEPLRCRLFDVLALKPGPVVVAPAVPVDYAMRVMTRNRQRHLPVCEGGRVVGVVSVGDILHHMTHELSGRVVDMTALLHGPWARPGDADLQWVRWYRYGEQA